MVPGGTRCAVAADRGACLPRIIRCFPCMFGFFQYLINHKESKPWWFTITFLKVDSTYHLQCPHHPTSGIHWLFFLIKTTFFMVKPPLFMVK